MSNAPGVDVGQPINFEIFLSTTEGTPTLRLTENEVWDADIAWAPDGRRIAFTSYRDGNDEIYVMGSDGSGQLNLTQDEASDFQPHWSPDGTVIVFGSDRSGTRGLFTMRPDGSDVVSLTTTEWSDTSPQWAPGGGKNLLITGVDSGNPSWHPDGDRIIFGRYVNEESRLLSAKADGSSVRPVGPT